MNQLFYYRKKGSILFCLCFFYFSCLSAQSFVSSSMGKTDPSDKFPSQERISLTDALKKLEKKFSVNFGYTDRTIENKYVSLDDIERSQLENSLKKILTPLQLRYQKIDEQFYLITPRRSPDYFPEKLGKQPLKNTESTLNKISFNKVSPSKKSINNQLIQVVTGTVTDHQSGTPLPGVNVLVKGTITGTVTGLNGNYSINVPDANDTLVFSSIGYVSQEIAVGGRSEVNVALSEDVTSLDEIVVVGYGTQKKENVIGAISTISGKEIENRPITNSTQALQGAKGVYVNQTGAQPGRSQATIRIRGQGTLNNNNPLVLVDGIEYPLENIDPNNIESISVLKDAAAASIYGARAANGVVLVTTKSGQGIEGFQINYNNYLGFEKVIGLPDLINDPVRFMELRDQAQRNAGRSTVDFGENLIEEYRQGMKTDPYVYPHNDWFDLIFDPGFIQNHNLRFSGGNQDYTYSLSLGYLDQEGVLRGTSSNKYSIDLNTKANISERLTVSAIINGQFTEFDEAVAGTPYVMEMTFKNAGVGFEPTYLEDGRYADTFIRTPGHYVFRNPLALTGEGMNNHKQQNYRMILGGEYSLPFNITYNIKGAYTKQDYLNAIFEPEVYQYNVKTLEKIRNRITGSPTRHAKKIDTYNYQLNLQQTLKWNNTLNNMHHFAALLGFSTQKFVDNTFSAYREGYLGNGLTTLNAGSVNPDVSGTNSVNSLMSLFGRLNYNYDERYLFEGNFRYDGSSKFAEGNKWGLFPSFSVGWRMGREEFMEDVSWLDEFKFRASWGKLGNERVPNFRFVNLINVGNDYSFGNTINAGAAVTQYSDPNITWETTTTSNIGVDAAMLSNSLNVSFELFKKRTTDILYATTIPAQVGGLGGPLRNIGTVDNQGFEASLTYQNSVGPFSYMVSGNLTRVKNEVVDLNGTTIYNYGSRNRGGTIIKEGYPINSYYLLHATGIFDTQEEIDSHAFQTQDTRPGYLKFEDANGDGVINQDDRIISDQNRIPTYTYSFNVGLDYKNFSLSAFFTGVSDVYTFRARTGDVPFWYGTGVTEEWVNNSWTPENMDAELPILTTFEDALNTNFRDSDFLLQNASFMRLKNIQLSYALPTNFLERIKLQSAKVFVNGQNIWTITPMDTFDPERDMGTDNASYDYPSVKTYTAGVQIGF
ncbi:TonB-linked SusC/RagA family outer membrane protein [Catalinimonas alkaloidigena]|nr:TonB-linked SusC/RagA family outer membrane protein [Catalinimonas alkaloidigena]